MHYHYATGIPGYGPDGADGFATADDILELADGLRSELLELANLLHDSADGHADADDYETAWFTLKNADELDTLRANLDPTRADAPLYRGKPELWHDTLRTLVAENFPLDIIDGSLRLYAWECNERDCEHCETD